MKKMTVCVFAIAIVLSGFSQASENRYFYRRRIGGFTASKKSQNIEDATAVVSVTVMEIS